MTTTPESVKSVSQSVTSVVVWLDGGIVVDEEEDDGRRTSLMMMITAKEEVQTNCSL